MSLASWRLKLRRLPGAIARVAGFGALFATALVSGACAGGSEKEVLSVAAASNLRFALEDVSRAFESRHPGAAVQFVFGSTGQLAQQITNGAPYDVFVAADLDVIQNLAAQGAIISDSARVFAHSPMALVINAAAGLPVTRLEDLKQAPPARLVIANPDHAPSGIAARQVLQQLGLWEQMQGRLVFAESAQQVTQIVRLGDAPAGFTTASLVIAERDLRVVRVPGALHEPIAQAVGITARTPRRALAERFVSFLLSEDGWAILQRYALEKP